MPVRSFDYNAPSSTETGRILVVSAAWLWFYGLLIIRGLTAWHQRLTSENFSANPKLMIVTEVARPAAETVQDRLPVNVR